MIGSGARCKWQQPLRQSSSFSSRPANVLICSLSASPGALPHTITATHAQMHTHAHAICTTHTGSLQSSHKFFFLSPDMRIEDREEQGQFVYILLHTKRLVFNVNSSQLFKFYIFNWTHPLNWGLIPFTATCNAPFWRFFFFLEQLVGFSVYVMLSVYVALTS